MRTWRKMTGPGDSSLITIAISSEERREQHERAHGETTRSIVRLRKQRRARQARRREADQRQALERVELRRRARSSRRSAGRRRPARLELLEVADQRRASRSCGSAREGDDHALDLELAHEPRAGRSSDPRSAGLRGWARAALGSTSTKPTTLSPYSGCWMSLRATVLADVAGADDQRVLKVGGHPAADGARDRARARHERDRRRPRRRRTCPAADSRGRSRRRLRRRARSRA